MIEYQLLIFCRNFHSVEDILSDNIDIVKVVQMYVLCVKSRQKSFHTIPKLVKR